MGFLSKLFRVRSENKKSSVKNLNNLQNENTSQANQNDLLLDKMSVINGMLNDHDFQRNNPGIFKSFLSELQINEPEIYKEYQESLKRENGNVNILNAIIPRIVLGQKPMESITDQDGKVHKIPQSTQFIIHPIFDNLGVIFQIDKGTYFERLQYKHIDNIPDFKTEEILKRACDNLMRQFSSEMDFHINEQGFGIIVKCKSFESSLILVDDVWQNIMQKVNSHKIIFTIPLQDIFCFCPFESNESLELLREKTNLVYSGASPKQLISANLYVKEKGKEIVLYKD